MARFAFVFDKAAYHVPSVRKLGLPEHQAYVHGGLFWGWAVERGLSASWLEDNTPEVFQRYRRGEITGPELLKVWDGALLDDMFSDEGLAFAADYLHFQRGSYLGDYIRTMAGGLPSEFHVADTPDNQRKLSAFLDERHREWREQWDPSSGRPDLRTSDEPAAEDRLLPPPELTAPVIPVGKGVPLPGGPLGIRAARPATLEAVRAAQAADGWILLAPGADDALDLGVLGQIQSATPVADHPDQIDVVIQCVARAELLRWVDRPGWLAELSVVPEPDPEDDDDMEILEEIRLLLADVLRQRVERGQPPGLLALAPSLGGARLVDVVGREVKLAREEALIVLEAPDLRTRAETVRDAVLRLL